MSLKTFPEIEQRSPDWYDQRRGLVTASIVGKMVTPSTLKVANNETSRGIVALLTGERISGNTDPERMSDDMWRGVVDEPLARDLYTETYAPVTTVGFMVRDDWGFSIGCSPDGLVEDDPEGPGGIEIKSRTQKNHVLTILAGDEGEVPAENMAQIQTNLLVTGRGWWDYISYCSGMAMWRKRVYPDPKWFEAIVAAVKAFETASVEAVTTYTDRVAGFPETERAAELEMF